MDEKKKGERMTTPKRKKMILEELHKTLGIVTPALKSTKTPRATYYKWLKDDTKFAEKVEEIQEIQLDFVEAKLVKQIQDDNMTAIIFYMKTKGKLRGYIEKTIIDLQNSEADDLSQYTNAELNQKIRDLKALKAHESDNKGNS